MRFGAARPDRIRVIVYGTHSADWMSALRPGARVWQQLSGVEEVLHTNTEGFEDPFPASAGTRTVVIPLMEEHISTCPTSYARLMPTTRAIQVLSNKAEFASYARANQLTHLCPEIYSSVDAAQFPCVLKRVDLNGGVGVRIVYSEQELRECVEQEPWRSRPYLLQSYVGGSRQSVAHCVCKDGRIVWHCSYAYHPAEPGTVCNRGRPAQRMTEPATRLAEFEAILGPLAYSGPCCIDYKVTDSGRTVVLEINPRFGGSLMRPDHVADLQAALTTIIALAQL